MISGLPNGQIISIQLCKHFMTLVLYRRPGLHLKVLSQLMVLFHLGAQNFRICNEVDAHICYISNDKKIWSNRSCFTKSKSRTTTRPSWLQLEKFEVVDFVLHDSLDLEERHLIAAGHLLCNVLLTSVARLPRQCILIFRRRG